MSFILNVSSTEGFVQVLATMPTFNRGYLKGTPHYENVLFTVFCDSTQADWWNLAVSLLILI